MHGSYAIRAQDLTKRFGQLVAVDDISFIVDEGEFFGFLGPNGAGKTTTVRMLTGLLPPDSGEAEVLGHDVQRESMQAKMKAGVVPEMANAYPDLTVWQNLMLMGELYGVKRERRRQRADELLEIFGLPDKKGAKAKFLSKGLRQRLLIAMALIHDPMILFLDEPTSGLDVKSTRMIRELLVGLNRNGCTIFLTTHNIAEASTLCSRVAILKKGKIAATGRPADLRSTFQRVQSVEVEFAGPVSEGEFTSLPGIRELKREGDRLRFMTDDPTRVASEIVELASGKGCSITSLEIRGPTLEDVFLDITEDEV